jgi:Tfp pilus assembly protein PilX
MNTLPCKKSIRKQNGAVLITALIFMIIMTMLALSSMGTNTLEEKMAANAAVSNLSFQGAEAGLEIIFNDENAFSTTGAAGYTVEDTDYAAKSGYPGSGFKVTATSTYQQQTISARGKKPSDSSTAFHHFNFKSEVSDGGIPTILNSGAYKTGPKL